VESLLRLSSVAKSISITQLFMDELHENTPHFFEDTLYFFGKMGYNWASTFIEMLHRKCDKLIINCDFVKYLRKEHADLLREQLPKINKKIWFCSSYDCYDEILEYMDNEYAIQADSWNDFERFLRVKHLARLNEKH
ncbi:hypothetical protein PMAYCL1PPCAC_20249, partial [Pristionchus mayeri]